MTKPVRPPMLRGESRRPKGVPGMLKSGPGSEAERDEEVRDEDEDEAEGRCPRVPVDPGRPTRKDIDEHFPLHAHYRSWRPPCQAGRSTSKQHRRREEDAVLGPSISLDYAFKYDDEKEEAITPVLVAVDKSKDEMGIGS